MRTAAIPLTWWEQPEADAHTAVYSALRRIRDEQSDRRDMLSLCSELYDLTYDEASLRRLWGSGEMPPLNVIESVIDTLGSEFESGRTRSTFLTVDGDFDLYRKAQQLTRFVDATCDDVAYYARVRPAATLDALVYGTAIRKVFGEHGRIRIEVVHPLDLYVDAADGREGDPRTTYQVAYYDRSVLAELYPEHRGLVLDAPEPAGDWAIGYESTADLVLVVEGWHLPSAPAAGDGRHVIAVETGVLQWREWTRDHPPLVVSRWKRRSRSYWGTSITEQLMGLQYAIDLQVEKILQINHLCAVPRILAPKGSGVSKSHLRNALVDVVEHAPGLAPQWMPAYSQGPEPYQWLDTMIRYAFDRVGVSQLAARAERPQGITSAKGLRTIVDVQSRRFLRAARELEWADTRIGELIVEEARELAERDPSFEVVYRGKTYLEVIPFRQVDLGEERFRLQTFPTSVLPTTVEGKLAFVEELRAAGYITEPETGLRILDLPDVEAHTRLVTAPLDAIEVQLDDILAGKPAPTPEPYMNLQLAQRIGELQFNRCIALRVPQEILDELSRWIELVKDLAARVPAPQPPAPQALPEGP